MCIVDIHLHFKTYLSVSVCDSSSEREFGCSIAEFLEVTMTFLTKFLARPVTIGWHSTAHRSLLCFVVYTEESRELYSSSFEITGIFMYAQRMQHITVFNFNSW